MCPLLFRPECFLRTSISDRSGSTFESSEKSSVVMKRRPGLVGLYFFTAIYLLLEVIHAAEFDLLTGLQRDDGFFEIRLLTAGFNTSTRKVTTLSAHVHRIDLQYIDLEDVLDGMPDLRFRCLRMHGKRILLAKRI